MDNRKICTLQTTCAILHNYTDALVLPITKLSRGIIMPIIYLALNQYMQLLLILLLDRQMTQHCRINTLPNILRSIQIHMK